MVMSILSLQELWDCRVGDVATRGISGGELKRLSIGVELINMPEIIFLDEPTSGLDSNMAHEVMLCVRNFANKNRTILSTVHQPSTDTYALFDKLLLLAEGRVVYFGAADNIVPYFTSSPFRFRFESGSNPAEFLIAVAGSFITAHDGQRVSGAELLEYYHASGLKKNFLQVAAQESQGEGDPELGGLVVDASADVSLSRGSQSPWSSSAKKGAYHSSTLYQTWVLCRRRVAIEIKNPSVKITSVARAAFVGFLYGTVYYQLAGGTAQSSYSNRISLFYLSCYIMTESHQRLMPRIISERPMFCREKEANLYGPLPYWASIVFVETPLVAVNSMVFTVLVFFMCGLYGGEHYERLWIFYYFSVAISFTGLFQAIMIAGFSSSPMVALAMFPLWILIPM
jgi:hypothetical protein